MLRILLITLAVLATGSTTTRTTPMLDDADSTLTSSTENTDNRGRYLVHDVAMCVQCHSPRDHKGQLKTDRLLSGGSIPFTNPYEGARWAFQAPNLRKLPGYTESDFLKLMQTGVRRDGTRPRSPMPQFRLSEEDSRAMYRYLLSQ